MILTQVSCSVCGEAASRPICFRTWFGLRVHAAHRKARAAYFVQLGDAPRAPRTLDGHAEKVCLALHSRAKSMLIDNDP
jgi:hypothetical protein